MPRNSGACPGGQRHRPGTIHSLRTLRRRYSKHRNRMNVSEVPKRQPTPYLLFIREPTCLSLSLSGVAFNMHRYTSSSLAHHHQECWQPPKRQCPHKNILLGVGWAEERMDGRGGFFFPFISNQQSSPITSSTRATMLPSSPRRPLFGSSPPSPCRGAAADFQHEILNGGIPVRAAASLQW